MLSNDQRQFLKVLSLSRAIHMFLTYMSFVMSRWFKRPLTWSKPFALSIEPTTSCNLRCPECPSGLRSFQRPTGMLDPVLFEKVIDETRHHLTYLTFYFQGEPYLNPQFLPMVKYAAQRKIYTATSTNAHYLDDENAQKTVESGLSRLIISLDGTTQETYEQYRVGGQLDKVLEGTRNVVKWKKKLKSSTPHIIFQFLVVAPNEHQLEEAKNLAEDLGVDEIKFKTAQIYDYENGSELIPQQEKYARYTKLSNGKWAIKNKLSNSCWKMWHSCVITWDGKVVPCCFDKDATYTMGTVGEQSFDTIWKNEAYQTFRQSLFHSRKEIDICKNCTEGLAIFEK